MLFYIKDKNHPDDEFLGYIRTTGHPSRQNGFCWVKDLNEATKFAGQDLLDFGRYFASYTLDNSNLEVVEIP